MFGPYHYGDQIFITQIYKFNELFLKASYTDFWSSRIWYQTTVFISPDIHWHLVNNRVWYQTTGQSLFLKQLCIIRAIAVFISLDDYYHSGFLKPKI